MKVLLILSVLMVASHATPLVYSAPPIIATGGSTQYNAADNLGNYNFGYDEGHLSGGSFRKEAGDAFGNKYGSYGLRDADGRIRVVNYVADANGFRADIKSNEPGLEPKDPANTYINKAAVIAPAVTYAAAAPVVTYAAAPKAYAAPVIAPAVTYAAAPIAKAYAPISYAAPFSYAYAPAPIKTYAAAPVAYASAPAAYVAAPTVYKGTPFVAAPAVYKGTPFVAAPAVYKGTPFAGPAIAV